MKTNILAVALLFCVNLFAQSPQISKRITGVQLGLITSNLYYECALNGTATLRFEGGGSLTYASVTDSRTLLLQPYFMVQPRFYYNVSKRVLKGLETEYNSANYIALQFKYLTPESVSIGDDFYTPVGSFSFIPTWGFRRKLGSRTHFEFHLGLGAGSNRLSPTRRQLIPVLDLGLRLGFELKKANRSSS